MISFNNNKIENVTDNDLSKQLFNIARYYSDIHLNNDYTTMFLSVAEYMESGFSNYTFSVHTFLLYNKDKNISMYEKNILIISYKKFLESISFNQNKSIFYKSIIHLLNSILISHKYIHFLNLSNEKNKKEREIIKEKKHYLNLIKNEIFTIYEFKKNNKDKEYIDIDMLNVALKELNYCLKLEELICI